MVMFVETLEPMKTQSLFGMLLAVGLMTSCGETTTPNTDSEEMTNIDLSVIPEIPVEDFFKNPEMASFQISPDGKYYSYRAPWESRMNIFVKEVGSDEATRITMGMRISIWSLLIPTGAS
jgi:hypothetical protein